MPHSRFEFHFRWDEGVIIGEQDVDVESTAGIWGIWGTGKPAKQVHYVVVVDRLRIHFRHLVFRHVIELFHDSASCCHRIQFKDEKDEREGMFYELR